MRAIPQPENGTAWTIVETRPITVGVDTHADVHVAAALDPIGGLPGVQEFAATAAGYARLMGWLGGFGTVALAGVEGTGSYGAGLARYITGVVSGSLRWTVLTSTLRGPGAPTAAGFARLPGRGHQPQRDDRPGLLPEGAVPLTLDVLSSAEAREMLSRRLGQDRAAAEPEAAEEIIEECARLPLALSIAVGRAACSPSGRWRN